MRLIEPLLEEGACRWLIDLGGWLVGVHAQTGWCVRVEDRVIALDEESKFVPLWPVLDVSEADFAAFLRRAAAAAPAWSRLVQSFPQRDAVEARLPHVVFELLARARARLACRRPRAVAAVPGRVEGVLDQQGDAAMRISAHRGHPFQRNADSVSDEGGHHFRLNADSVSI